MNNRRELIVVLGAGALTAPFSAFAQQQGKVWRIGFLAPVAPPGHILETFRGALRELGYIEGKNLAVEYRWTTEMNASLPKLASELLRLNVDLVFAWTTPPTLALKQATSTIPIVMVGVADPVGTGLVTSFAQPGGNITGVSNMSTDLSAKLVQMLLQMAPRVRRLAVLRVASNSSLVLQLQETEAAARLLGLPLQLVDVRAATDFEPAFAKMSEAHVEGVVVLPDALIVGQRQLIADLALRHRLPTIFSRGENAEAGGLLAYGASLSEQVRRGVYYVDRIFKGTKPADLPVEQPTRFELIINRKTARALGLTIPADLMIMATKIIE